MEGGGVIEHIRRDGRERIASTGSAPAPPTRVRSTQRILAIQRRAGNRTATDLVARSTTTPARALPDAQRARAEALSGISMDDVTVHRNSPDPARLGALAYTEGTRIHLGPGQDRHLAHEVWHVVQQKQDRVPPTTKIRGRNVNLDQRLEREADAMAGRPEPTSEAPANAVRRVVRMPVLQGLFDLTAENFKALIVEQCEDQEAVVGGASTAGLTTLGFEHEFAQMEKGGPLTGVSHLELSGSAETMPYNGINFILETDANRALELVSPPFFVQTVPGTMIPKADHVRKMDRLMQERLSALVADKPSLGTLAASFGADPGLTFKIKASKVEPANIGHETKGDFHKDSPPVAAETLSAIKVQPSSKGSSSVIEHDISAQANFATDLTTLEQVQAQSRKELGDYSKPFAALEAQLMELLTASYARSETNVVKIADQATRLPRFLRQLAGPLSGELAVPSMKFAREYQEAIFDDTTQHTRNQKRKKIQDDKGVDREVFNFHRMMASHVKDVGSVWVKDTALNIGLGVLTKKTDWVSVRKILLDPTLRGAVGSLQPKAFFAGKERIAYQASYNVAKVGIVTALAQLGTHVLDILRRDPATYAETFKQPAARPEFLGHDPAHTGARQDTYLRGDKVQLPGHAGRLHVVETRGDALGTVDRLHMSHLFKTSTMDDSAIADEIGHEDDTIVKQYRDERIAELLKAGVDPDAIAADLHVSKSRVIAVKDRK